MWTGNLCFPDDGVVSTQISSDGTYRFGPLDASHTYSVSMSKESYVFSAADAAGDVLATKLAEIHVQLLDEDGIPLQVRFYNIVYHI